MATWRIASATKTHKNRAHPWATRRACSLLNTSEDTLCPPQSTVCRRWQSNCRCCSWASLVADSGDDQPSRVLPCPGVEAVAAAPADVSENASSADCSCHSHCSFRNLTVLAASPMAFANANRSFSSPADIPRKSVELRVFSHLLLCMSRSLQLLQKTRVPSVESNSRSHFSRKPNALPC